MPNSLFVPKIDDDQPGRVANYESHQGRKSRVGRKTHKLPQPEPHRPTAYCVSLLPEISFLTGSSPISHLEPTLEQMARSLVESGDYRVTSRLEPQAQYHRADDTPKLVAAVVDVETTGTNPDRDRIIELGICLFEYDRQNGWIYKVLGSWEWLEDAGFPIPPEITKITGITDEMVAGHRIDDRAVNNLIDRAVLVIAHNADFDRRFLERRLPAFATKHWACSRSDIDWKAEGVRSSALEFVAYSLGFFHDGHRAGSDCRGHPSCTGSTASWHGAVGIAGSLGTSEIADVAVMGKGCRD